MISRNWFWLCVSGGGEGYPNWYAPDLEKGGAAQRAADAKRGALVRPSAPERGARGGTERGALARPELGKEVEKQKEARHASAADLLPAVLRARDGHEALDNVVEVMSRGSPPQVLTAMRRRLEALRETPQYNDFWSFVCDLRRARVADATGCYQLELRLMVSVRSGRGMGPVKRISHVEARPHKVLSFCW